MKMVMRAPFSAVAILVLAFLINTTVQAQSRIGIEDRFAVVNGVRLHYLIRSSTNRSNRIRLGGNMDLHSNDLLVSRTGDALNCLHNFTWEPK